MQGSYLHNNVEDEIHHQVGEKYDKHVRSKVSQLQVVAHRHQSAIADVCCNQQRFKLNNAGRTRW